MKRAPFLNQVTTLMVVDLARLKYQATIGEVLFRTPLHFKVNADKLRFRLSFLNRRLENLKLNYDGGADGRIRTSVARMHPDYKSGGVDHCPTSAKIGNLYQVTSLRLPCFFV